MKKTITSTLQIRFFNGKDVLILGGLNSGISPYLDNINITNPLLILCYSDINELVYYMLLYTIKMTQQTYRNN